MANSGLLSEQETRLIILCKEDSKYLSSIFNIAGNVCRLNPDFKFTFLRNVLTDGELLPYIEIPDRVEKN